MKQLWIKLGQLAFWCSWPPLWVYLRKSRRTRVLLVYAGRVLVVKGWLGDGKWLLPGGGVHKQEDPFAGVLRELEEETGIRLPRSTLSLRGERRVRSNGLEFTALFYTAAAPELYRLQPQKLEIVEARWLPAQELNQGNAAPDTLMALEAWL